MDKKIKEEIASCIVELKNSRGIVLNQSNLYYWDIIRNGFFVAVNASEDKGEFSVVFCACAGDQEVARSVVFQKLAPAVIKMQMLTVIEEFVNAYGSR